MNAKKIFSLLLALFGEALIVFCFLHFGKNVQTEILILNIIVSTIIYCLVFVDFIFPWVNLKDKSQKQIGSIGLRWFFTFFYLILAIGVIYPVIGVFITGYFYALFWVLIGGKSHENN